MSTMIETSAAM